MDLDAALAKHAEWKVKFRSAITKKEKLDAASIRKDNGCDLGKWLHGEGRRDHGTLGSFTDTVTKHASFHVEAGKVADAINAGKFDQAGTMMEPASTFSAASSAVGSAIIRLKKDAKI